MNASLLALLAFAVTFAAALAGLWLRDRLPEHHLDGESRDTVKLVMGLVATMSALVLGLLISVTQTAYRTQSDELALLAANIVALDRVLLHYGPEAAPLRDDAAPGRRRGSAACRPSGARPGAGARGRRIRSPSMPRYGSCSRHRRPNAWALPGRSS